MKLFSFLIVSVLFTAYSCSQNTDYDQKESFKVYGNCGMCQNTIESSLADVDGIHSANWDVDSKQITVKFNSEDISLEEIKKRIAKVGYDSDDFRAKDATYKSLPSCCQYERPE